MRDSCISHPQRQIMAVVRQDYYLLMNQDCIAAAILNIFEYWANGAIASKADEQDPWVGIRTAKEFEEMLLGLATEKHIRKRLHELEQLGFIHTRQPIAHRKSFEYRFMTSAVQEALNKLNGQTTVGLGESQRSNDRWASGQTTVGTEESQRSNDRSTIYRKNLIKEDQEESPLTPQGERERGSFGFEIPESSVPNTPASLESKSESLHLTTSQSMKTITPAAPQDPFFAKHRRSSDVVWDWLPEGPWKIGGKLCSSFLDAIAHRWVKDYGGDVHTNKLKVQKHFRNDPTNLPIEWEWYQSTYLHKAANVQTRKAHGIDTAKDEQEIINHVAAFNPLPDEVRVTRTQSATQFIGDVAPYATHSIATAQAQPVAQLESVATVEDDVWETIAQQTSEWEEQQQTQTVPEGADNPAAYQNVVKADDRDFWANLHKNSSETIAPTQSPAPISIAQLVAAKSMPEWDREKENQQKRTRTKLEYWNELLASGIPSVIADVECQARAQGYVVIDGQISEVDF